MNGKHEAALMQAHSLPTAQACLTDAPPDLTPVFGMMFTQAPVGIALIDRAGRLKLVNQRFCQMVGRSQDSLVGSPWIELTFPEDRPQAERHFEHLVATGHPYTLEDRAVRPDGRLLWVQRAVSMVGPVDGIGQMVLAIVLDVTNRRHSAALLLENEQRFQLATAAISGMVYDMDLHTGEIWRSPGMRELIGFDSDQVPHTADWWFSRMHPEDLPEFERCFQHALNARQPSFASEYRVRHRTAGWIWVWDQMQIVYGPDSHPARVVGCRVSVDERRRAEEALRNSEERFRSLFDQAAVGIAQVTFDGTITEVNPGLCRMLGHAAEALVGRPLRELVHPEDVAVAEKNAADLLRGEHPKSSEVRYRCEDGSYRWTETTLSLIRHRGRRAGGVVLIAQDVTPRKRADEAVHHQQRLVQSLFDNIPGPVYVKDQSGRLLMVNRRFAELARRPVDELVGRQDTEIFSGPDFSAIQENDRRTLAGEGVMQFEEQLPLADGRHTFLSIKFPVSEVGFPGRVLVGFSTDITDWQRAQQALLESERRFRGFAENSEDVLWIVSAADQRVVYVSPSFERMYGRPLSAAYVDPMRRLEYVHPEDRARAREAWRECSRATSSQEFRVLRPEGSVVWVRDRGFPILDDAGELRYIAGISEDITARRQAAAEREQLLESERAARSEAERHSRLKDEFLATLSHELRTPLTAIQGWAQLLRRGTLSGSSAKEAVAIIERNARSQAQLIDDLLDVNRLASGKIRLERRPLALDQVVDQAIEAVQHAADSKRLRMVRDFPAEPIRLEGDARRLSQVVWNLLTNAIKFTPPGGQITVQLCQEGPFAAIRVRDTGQGIRPDFLPYLFERFRQADASVTRSQGGLGLGLSLVKQLTELHGGSVRAESEGEGRGATFTIQLPMSVPAESWTAPKGEDRRPDTGAAAAESLAGARVLVVEDEPDTRQYLQRVLEQAEAEVVAVGTAAEAMDSFAERVPDVLLSDIGMPGEDGFSLIRRIRDAAVARGVVVPAIALTALARPEDRRRALISGYQVHLKKPIDPADLIAAVLRVRGTSRP